MNEIWNITNSSGYTLIDVSIPTSKNGAKNFVTQIETIDNIDGLSTDNGK